MDSDSLQGKCGTCRFWERWGTEAGGCKRYPPIMPNFNVMARQREYDRIEVSMATDPKPYWPNTDQTQWCGEHEPAQKTEGA